MVRRAEVLDGSCCGGPTAVVTWNPVQRGACPDDMTLNRTPNPRDPGPAHPDLPALGR